MYIQFDNDSIRTRRQSIDYTRVNIPVRFAAHPVNENSNTLPWPTQVKLTNLLFLHCVAMVYVLIIYDLTNYIISYTVAYKLYYVDSAVIEG